VAEPVIFSGEADFESIVAGFDEIIAAAEAASEAVAQFGAASGELSGFDEILSAIQAQTDAVTAGFDQIDSSLSSLTDLADTSASALQSLDTTLSEMAAAGAEAADSLQPLDEEMQAKAEDAATMMDALNALQGSLMMIGAITLMVGDKFVSMGMDGQKGEALLSGMAGASSQDIAALQQEALKLGVSMDQASAGFYEVESAGYSGTGAIKVFDAAMKLAEGGQAQASDVMTGLTAIMHDYNLGADQATYVTDRMREAVFLGKQSMQDFATSIGTLAAAAANAGVSMDEMLAAESAMTQINPHVRQDTMQLAGLFQSLSPTMGHTAETAKSLGLAFNEDHYASLSLIGKLQYLAGIAGGDNTAAFVKLTGGVRGSTAAIDILTGKGKTYIANLQAIEGANGATEQSFADWEKTIPSHLDKVGAAFSVFSTRLMDAIGPKINPLIDKVAEGISNLSDSLVSHLDKLMPVLAGLAAMLGTVLVAAIGAFTVALVTNPIFLIAAAIGVLVTGIILLVQHWHEITSAIGNNPVFQAIWNILKDIGSYLTGLFLPIWQQLVALWQGTIVPAFHQLVEAVQPLMPLFIGLAELIGGIVVVALGLLFGALTGIIKGAALALSGIIQAFGGIVKIITGAVQVVSGIIHFFIDLLTGNFKNLGSDLGGIWHGIVNMFQGAWDTISGIFKAAWGAISGFVSGLVDGVIGFFQHLFDTLVGHSIIPDMISSIIQWFASLPGKALSAIGSLAGQLAGFFGNLASQAISWGSNIIGGLISGIQSMAGAVGNAVGGILGGIRNLFPHSPPKEGPLRDIYEWMPTFGDILAQGLQAQIGKISGAGLHVAAAITQTVAPVAAPPAMQSPGVFGGGSNNQAIMLLAQIAAGLQRTGKPTGPQVPPTVNMWNQNSLYGVTNINDMYAALNSLQGYSFEQGGRGML
jgi:TP901 family phage tail tape measure protein